MQESNMMLANYSFYKIFRVVLKVNMGKEGGVIMIGQGINNFHLFREKSLKSKFKVWKCEK